MKTKRQSSGQKIIATIKEKINEEKRDIGKINRIYGAHDDWGWDHWSWSNH